MARQTYYITRDVRHPLYKTRMLTAGEGIDLDASAARLYRQLGVVMTDEKPRRKVGEPTAGTVEAPKAPARKRVRKAKAKK